MDDLISREELINAILRCIRTPRSTIESNSTPILFIERQPTAYDPDRVVEQLEEKGEDDSYCGAMTILSDDAIEIVRGGGIN